MNSAELLNVCKKILDTKNPKNIYKKLADIFYDAGLVAQKAEFIKKIWHITCDDEDLLKVGDIYLEEAFEAEPAYQAYDLYFQRKDPMLYIKYKYSLCDKGYGELHPKIDKLNYFSEIVKLLDKYFAIGRIIIYFYQYNEYDAILKAKDYLDKAFTNIENYVETSEFEDYPFIEKLTEFNKKLSEVLSKTEQNIEIIYLAIELDPEQKDAYINLIDYYVQNSNYEDALYAYNSAYKIFEKDKVKSIPKMLYIMSNIFAERNYFYKSVMYKKLAIEYELEKGIK